MRAVALLASLAVGVLLASLAVDAQQPGKVYRIGLLSPFLHVPGRSG